MKRNNLVIILIVSVLGAVGFYMEVPTSWMVDLEWEIVTKQPPLKDRVIDYHEDWLKVLDQKDITSHVKEQQCTLVQKHWKCQYHAFHRNSYHQLLASAQEDFPKVSGWVDPLDLQRDIVRFEEQTETLTHAISNLQSKMSGLEKKITPQKKAIDKMIHERDLVEQNLVLRNRQVEILDQLLPSMDPNSELYQVYSQSQSEAFGKINKLQTQQKKIDQDILKNASDWVEYVKLEEQKNSIENDLMRLHQQKEDYDRALTTRFLDKVAHPRGYAFLLSDQQVQTQKEWEAFLASFLVFFFVISNGHLTLQRQKNRFFKASPDSELTMRVDMEKTPTGK